METLAHRMGELDPDRRRVRARWPTASTAWTANSATATATRSRRRWAPCSPAWASARKTGPAHRGVLRRLADAHRAGQTAAAEAQPAAARRADQPPRPRSAQLAGRVSARLSLRLRADLARPLFPRCHRRARSPRSGTSRSTSTRQLREVPAAEDRAARRSWRPPTATSGTASSNWKPSSTASATRPPRPSRCRAASRNWRRSSASRSRPKRRPSTSPFRSPSPAGAWWPSSSGVSKSYGDESRSSRGVNFVIERGDRIALVGVNGAGKSTLIKLLAGSEPLTAGEYTLGHNVDARLLRAGPVQGTRPRRAHARRSLDACAERHDDNGTAQPARLLPVLRGRRLQADRRAVGRRAQPLRAGAHAAASRRTSCCSTSPPTTWTCAPRTCCWKRSQKFTGTVVFVSHDRYFIDKLATRVFEIGDGQVRIYPGQLRRLPVAQGSAARRRVGAVSVSAAGAIAADPERRKAETPQPDQAAAAAGALPGDRGRNRARSKPKSPATKPNSPTSRASTRPCASAVCSSSAAPASGGSWRSGKRPRLCYHRQRKSEIA